mgnify:FL=1
MIDFNYIFDPVLEPYVIESDIVIHLAAQVSVQQSFENSSNSFHVNVLGTARVVELCKRYGKKLIYPSSAAVYHPDLSPYAESKKMAEDIVRKVYADNSVILRFFNIYGENMNKNSGSIMYNFLHDDEIVVYGDGEQTRDYINVKDIVNIIESSIDDSWNGEIVDCGSGYAYSTNYVAGLFAHFRKKKIKYVPPKREIKWSIADTTRLKKLYKNSLQTNLLKDIEALCKV